MQKLWCLRNEEGELVLAKDEEMDGWLGPACSADRDRIRSPLLYWNEREARMAKEFAFHHWSSPFKNLTIESFLECKEVSK